MGRRRLNPPGGDGNQERFEFYQQYSAGHGLGALAELIETRLDERAGPWRLTDRERADRRACRSEFGIYDPGSSRQRAWLRDRNKPEQVAA